MKRSISAERSVQLNDREAKRAMTRLESLDLMWVSRLTISIGCFSAIGVASTPASASFPSRRCCCLRRARAIMQADRSENGRRNWWVAEQLRRQAAQEEEAAEKPVVALYLLSVAALPKWLAMRGLGTR